MFKLLFDGQSAARIRLQHVQLESQAILDLLNRSVVEVHRITRLIILLLHSIAEAQVLCNGRLAGSADHGSAALGPRLAHSLLITKNLAWLLKLFLCLLQDTFHLLF